MIKKTVVIFYVFLGLILFCRSETVAAEKFGLLFDIQGNAEIRSADSRITKLKKSEHLLLPVREGDRIRVILGKVVVASMKESKGYEILQGSEVFINGGKIIVIKGTLNKIKGLYAADKFANGALGGVALRGLAKKGGFSSMSCLRTLSPVDAYLLDLTPELFWEYDCSGNTIFTVKVLSGDMEVLNFETREHSLRIPSGVLEYGGRYKWLVESEGTHNIAEGSFSIYKENEAISINDQIKFYRTRYNELPFRLSYIFYLLDKGLKDMARAEVEALEGDFPDNPYIVVLSSRP